MNQYIIHSTPDRAGNDAAYAIAHMYARWATRKKIAFTFNCHPKEESKYILEIDADLSNERGIHTYCWKPEYEECKGCRFTHYVYFSDTLKRSEGILRRYILSPYLRVYGLKIEYRGSHVLKILDGKIPWL